MKNHIENEKKIEDKKNLTKKRTQLFVIVAVCLAIIYSLILDLNLINRIDKCDCLKLLDSRGNMTGYELRMLGYSDKEVKDQEYCIRKYDYSQDFILKCLNE